MNANNDPAVLFYTGDFLVGVMTMTNEQIGKYIRLLCLQHQKGHLSKMEMMSICNGEDEAVFEKFKIDEDGKYFNVRMDAEIQKRASAAEAHRIAGRFGGRPKKEPNGNQMVIQKQTKSKPKADPKQNLTENENGNENGNEIKNEDSDFDRFWEAYPRKTAKQAAKQAFKKVKAPIETLLDALEEQKHSKAWTKENGQFIPYPATWLNGCRWEDEVESSLKKLPTRKGDDDRAMAIARIRKEMELNG